MLTTGGVFVTVIDAAVLVDPSASVIDAVIVCVPFDSRLVASAAADRAVLLDVQAIELLRLP